MLTKWITNGIIKMVTYMYLLRDTSLFHIFATAILKYCYCKEVIRYMINSLKTIAVFGCQFTSRYRQNLCRAFNTAAEEFGVNLVYFNSLGNIGEKYTQYGKYEYEINEYIDLSPFDGIIFDGEGYNVDGMADRIIDKLRGAKCPVISISSKVEGFHNIDYDDAEGVRILTEHFIKHHKFTRIGFMSGYLTHPDAKVRLDEFRKVMRKNGLPQDGAGIFEGDFWFFKGDEAADFFLSLDELPEAIVCANDYMAISLITALKKRGIEVPEDIAVSGFDGSVEGMEFMPHITSVSRERLDIARRSIQLILEKSEGKNEVSDLHIVPKAIFSHSCGCEPIDYKNEINNINILYSISRDFVGYLTDAESSMLMLNKVTDIKKLSFVLNNYFDNFGKFSSFFLMSHIDICGRYSHDSDFSAPTGEFSPIIWIDKKNSYLRTDKNYHGSSLIPESISNKPHFYYLMSTQCADRMFGYALLEMEGKDIFSEFYNVWLLNISLTLETLLKNDRINKLIRSLENLSIRDGLTGMLNRRGFDELSRESIDSFDDEHTVCTIVIDMDGLKHINDDYGHHEGDCAIRTAADLITKCCDSGEIAGRAGGDEFYIFAPSYSERKLNRFIERLTELARKYNCSSHKPYRIELSFGAYLTECDSTDSLDELLRVSDQRMYKQKMSKPNRRK